MTKCYEQQFPQIENDWTIEQCILKVYEELGELQQEIKQGNKLFATFEYANVLQAAETLWSKFDDFDKGFGYQMTVEKNAKRDYYGSDFDIKEWYGEDDE